MMKKTCSIATLLLRLGQATSNQAHMALLNNVNPLSLPSRRSKVSMQFTNEPTLQEFVVSGGPVVVNASDNRKIEDTDAERKSEKPILLYLPGIEFSGYSLHRQIPELSEDFEVRFLATSSNDRTAFGDMVDIVKTTIAAEFNTTGRQTYLLGESFGGVLALHVALSGKRTPNGLAGLALINPATSLARSWPSNLQPLLDGVSALPPGLSNLTYLALATPIFAGISGDPLQLGGRIEDDNLPKPLQVATSLARLIASFPLLTELPQALPLPALAFRLSMLSKAAEEVGQLKLEKLTLPVHIFASSEDRVLPSVSEGRRLVQKLPNARLTVLDDSGHVPLLEVRVRLAALLRKARLTERKPAPRKDYVTDFQRPSADDFAKASESLLPIRKLTSPIFLSTDAAGKRISGLRALPAMSEGPSESHSIPPVVFVGNHQLYGFQDLPLVVEEIHKQTGVLVRALAHPVVFANSLRDDGSSESTDDTETSANRDQRAARGGLVDYEKFGAVPVSPRTFFKLVSRGENTLLYPGGVREAFKSTKRGETYKLFWPPASESADFVRVASRFGATIVPVAAVGAEEGFEMLLDADEMLNIPFLGQQIAESANNTPVGRPGERFVAPFSVPKVPGRYYFLFGKPFDTRTIDAADKEACKNLYVAVQAELEQSVQYLLEKRKSDAWESALPRALIEASWNWTRQAPSFRI